jgi:hypothetical protein
MTGATLKAPAALGLAPATDTGTKGDGTTSARLYQLTGTATAGKLVQLFRAGTSTPIETESVAANGTFTFNKIPAQTTNGTISFVAYEMDVAGNLSKASTGTTVRIATSPGDFNADGTAEAMTYSRASGVFAVTPGNYTTSFNQGPLVYQGRPLSGPGMIPIEGDYNGDGQADFGVYDTTTATFYIQQTASGGGSLVAVPYGWAGHDLPIVGDFDGDGKTDIAVYRPENSTFYIRLSSTTNLSGSAGVQVAIAYGWAGHDQPVVADYNGDGVSDIAVYRAETAQWFVMPTRISPAGAVSSTGPQAAYQFGWGGVDKAIPADYDGDGKADLAVYRPVGSAAGQSQGQFYVQSSRTAQTTVTNVGTPGQVDASAIPEALDFNGDGKADPAVFQPSSSRWTIAYSGAAAVSFSNNASGGIPVDAPLFPYRLPATTAQVRAASVGGLQDFIPASDAPKAADPTASTSATASAASTTSTAPASTASTASAATVQAPAPPVLAPVAVPQTGTIGSSRLAQFRRLALLQQRQARLQQALLARQSSARAGNGRVPGGALALRNHPGFRGL